MISVSIRSISTVGEYRNVISRADHGDELTVAVVDSEAGVVLADQCLQVLAPCAQKGLQGALELIPALREGGLWWGLARSARPQAPKVRKVAAVPCFRPEVLGAG
ncbi:hypothetical protein [Streptomyces sp. 840.1]|uniref:hypothetical protein n=1 Tax=Streptomyces sp. 840.1 TaxID=2485152 RepID=UPI000F49BDF8|nr:hypothetical protein [Streptomyces sp. 840.1]